MKKLIMCGLFGGLAVQGFALPVGLRCEHLAEPLGIDAAAPRLGWGMTVDKGGGSRQMAYRVLVDTDSASVAQSNGKIWDSGKIESDRMLVRYDGLALNPFTRYYWRVCQWDENGNESASDVASFETGMMGQSHWHGCWIGDGKGRDYKPAPYYRKSFGINPEKKVACARVYVATGGLHELFVNGARIGDHRLDPLYTRYDRRNLYVVHDVTSQLQSGENVIGVVLGNGWYNHQSGAVWNFENAPWRNRPTFCLDLRIDYTDGSCDVIGSDLDWKCSYGPLRFNSIYTSEHYDAGKEQKGWNAPGFDDSAWGGVGYRQAPSSNIVAQQAVPIRRTREYRPVSLTKLDDCHYVYDFGQNMAGVTRLMMKGEEGVTLKLKHAERVHADGHVDQSNIDVYFRPFEPEDLFQTDVVTLGCDSIDFSAAFNYKGFRYVEVEADKPVVMDESSLMAYEQHSDVRKVGHIVASNPIIGKLMHASDMSYLSNLMGYPTDCPQREKNGWTGDGHLAVETGLYNFDGITVYEKWMADHRDEQQPNGVLPDIIPTCGWGYGTANGLDWTSTIAIIPWNLYLFYGDVKPLEDCYDNIRRYVDYVDRHSENGLTSWGRGDWVPVKSRSSLELTSSVYFYVDATILARAAALLGKGDDARHYSDLAQKIREAINAKYLDRSTGIYASGTQTELSVPLMWGVVPDDMKGKVAANLARKVEEADWHLDVGVLGAKAILNALSENGYANVAYRLAVQDTYPSWGWWVANGATTLLENWDLEATRDISDNHMMFGELGAWFFKGLAGLKPDVENPGFRHILLSPAFIGPDKFSVAYDSPSGRIEAGWEIRKREIRYKVSVPANTTATLRLPAHVEGPAEQELLPGDHELKFKIRKKG